MKAFNNKYVKYGSVTLLIAVTGYLIWNKIQKKRDIKYINDVLDGAIPDPSTGGAQKVITKAQAAALPDGVFPLKFKDRSKKVLALQQALNKKYGSSIDTDGVFGQSTASALCKNYFSTCFTDVQSRTYEVTNEDFNKINK